MGKSEWKRCILELSEELFFAIIRTYLGEIQTPFHKPRLVDHLAAFLRDDETKKRMLALIDPYDAAVLTAVDILDQPDGARLYEFFQDEREYFNFHNHLLNLQERLLIFTCPENGRLRLNPYLETELRHKIIAPKLLFPPAVPLPSAKSKAARTTAPVLLTEETVWALLSFLLHREDLFRNDGTFRKKTADQLHGIFPRLAAEKGFSLAHRILRGLTMVGVIALNPSSLTPRLLPDPEIGRLPRPLRLSALWVAVLLAPFTTAAATATTDSTATTSTPSTAESASIAGAGNFSDEIVSFSRVEQLALHFFRFLMTTPRNILFSPSSIRRLLLMCGFFQTASSVGTSLAGASPAASEPAEYHTIETGLLDLKILLRHKEGLYLNPQLDSLLTEESNPKPLLPHPDYSVTVRPPLEYETGQFIASVMEITGYGTYPQFELTGKAYLHARENYESGEIRETLGSLSNTPLPQNISFSLQAWENNYSSVFMMEGIVLVLAEHWNRIVRHHPEFQKHVIRDLDNGIFVMNPDTPAVWRRLLQEMGVSPLPPLRRPREQTSVHRTGEDTKKEWPALKQNSIPLDFSVDFQENEDSTEAGKKIHAELIGALEGMDMKAGEEKEVLSRIDHKLYLFPSQLRHPVLSDAASEARGIDYAGKVRVIQQALQSRGAVLELVERTGGGKPARHLVRPRELEKSGRDLLLHGTRLPLKEEMTIRVEKIGYIKKWKSSLFIQPEDYTPS